MESNSRDAQSVALSFRLFGGRHNRNIDKVPISDPLSDPLEHSIHSHSGPHPHHIATPHLQCVRVDAPQLQSPTTGTVTNHNHSHQPQSQPYALLTAAPDLTPYHAVSPHPNTSHHIPYQLSQTNPTSHHLTPVLRAVTGRRLATAAAVEARVVGGAPSH